RRRAPPCRLWFVLPERKQSAQTNGGNDEHRSDSAHAVLLPRYRGLFVVVIVGRVNGVVAVVGGAGEGAAEGEEGDDAQQDEVAEFHGAISMTRTRAPAAWAGSFSPRTSNAFARASVNTSADPFQLNGLTPPASNKIA